MESIEAISARTSAGAEETPPAAMSIPPSDRAADVGRRVVKGAAWTVAARLSVRSLGLVSMIILARLLVPADFGLVALAFTVVGALDVATDFGFQWALIRKQMATRRDYDTVWSLSIIRNGIIALSLAASAHLFGQLFDEPKLESVLYVLALGMLIDGFTNVGIIDFIKDIEFHKEFFLLGAVKVTGFIITIALAFSWRDHWALVAGILGSNCMRVASSYALHRYRPRWSLHHWREYLGFGTSMLVCSVGNYLNTRLPILVLGKISGAQSVGVYTLANDIASFFAGEVLAPVRRAMIPGYVKLTDDTTALKQMFLDGFSLTLLIAGPINIGISLLAEPMVAVILGSQWMPAVQVIQVLAIASVMQSISPMGTNIFMATGRHRLMVLEVLVMFAVVAAVLPWNVAERGLYGAAFAIAVGSSVTAVVQLYVATRILRMERRKLLSQTWRALAALVVMVGAVTAFQAASASMGVDTNARRLTAGVAVGVVAYIGSLAVLWQLAGRPKGPESLLIAFVRQTQRTDANRRGVGEVTL